MGQGNAEASSPRHRCGNVSHNRTGDFSGQSISACAVYIDLCFLNEKEKCSFARPPEFTKSTWERGTWGASFPGGQPGQVKRGPDILVLCYPRCQLGHRGTLCA